jgi:sugar lactone lactonase YvrE
MSSAHRRLACALLTTIAALGLAVPSPGVARGPDVVPLPNGWQPEGISSGPGGALFVGSIPTGAVYRADARTGAGAILVPPHQGRAATGVKASRGLLYVAGAATGHAYVYDARTGADVADLELTTSPSFINDVVLTRKAAWFTDSRNQQLYRVARDGSGKPAGPAVRIPISGDFAYDDDPATTDANGIVSGHRGALLVVQSRTGLLFRIDPKTGASTRVPLKGGDVLNGDGMLLRGRTLYVVQNRLNRIAVVRLDRRVRSGRIVGTITNGAFDVPTTITKRGGDLFAVNARFGTPSPGSTSYTVVRVPSNTRDDH